MILLLFSPLSHFLGRRRSNRNQNRCSECAMCNVNQLQFARHCRLVRNFILHSLVRQCAHEDNEFHTISFSSFSSLFIIRNDVLLILSFLLFIFHWPHEHKREQTKNESKYFYAYFFTYSFYSFIVYRQLSDASARFTCTLNMAKQCVISFLLPF